MGSFLFDVIAIRDIFIRCEGFEFLKNECEFDIIKTLDDNNFKK